MFRAYMLETCRGMKNIIVKQKFCTSSWLITEMHGQQNVKIHEIRVCVSIFCTILYTIIYSVYTQPYISIVIYTGCPRRNMPDFRRVFLMLNYTDITQNTYV